MRNFTRLRLGTTTSPHDSQVLGAVAIGKIQLHAADLKFDTADIGALNRAALGREYDIIKVSCAMVGRIARDYELLDTGAALAEQNGPLLLARPGLERADLPGARILAPGATTSGAQLFRRWAPRGAELQYCGAADILPALRAGECDAAVLPHEGCHSQAHQGLAALVDLGAWWREHTGLPVPLGCYMIRRHLHERFSEPVEQLMRCALRVAERGDAEVANYVRSHAPEADEAGLRKHLSTYVNHYTRSLGQRGRAAIQALNGAASA